MEQEKEHLTAEKEELTAQIAESRADIQNLKDDKEQAIKAKQEAEQKAGSAEKEIKSLEDRREQLQPIMDSVSKEIKEYTPEELDKKVNELINAKIKNITHQENSILDKKVLKKEENNSTISIDIFIVAEEELGQQVIITEE